MALLSGFIVALGFFGINGSLLAQEKVLKVVVSNSAYQPIAEYIGKDLVQVSHIVHGAQDPHTFRPKPAHSEMLKTADLFVETGLDLEPWSTALVEISQNKNIRRGQAGHVFASTGVKIIEKPYLMPRDQGAKHVMGNPHIHTSPINGKIIADNIAAGLKKIAPDSAAVFDENLNRFKTEIDRRLYGKELLEALGSRRLEEAAQAGRLFEFLEKKQYQGRPLVDLLGGWMKEAKPFRGKKLVAYHRNMSYFFALFGLKLVTCLEPRVGMQPSPGHLSRVEKQMKNENIKVIWAENYFDMGTVRELSRRVNAVPVIVGLGPGGQEEKEEMDDYFKMFDIWIQELNNAFSQIK